MWNLCKATSHGPSSKGIQIHVTIYNNNYGCAGGDQTCVSGFLGQYTNHYTIVPRYLVYQICYYQSSMADSDDIFTVLSHCESPLLLYRYYSPDHMISRTRGLIMGRLLVHGEQSWTKCLPLLEQEYISRISRNWNYLKVCKSSTCI